MAVSVNAIAYSAVAIAAVVLFAIGSPAQRAHDAALVAPSAAATLPAVAAAGPAPAPSPLAVASAAGVSLHSVTIALPASDRLFPGDASAEAINANCVTCHSAGMVLNQPLLTRTDWESEVNKMRNVYKAPVAAEDVPAIVAYLAALKPGG